MLHAVEHLEPLPFVFTEFQVVDVVSVVIPCDLLCFISPGSRFSTYVIELYIFWRDTMTRGIRADVVQYTACYTSTSSPRGAITMALQGDAHRLPEGTAGNNDGWDEPPKLAWTGLLALVSPKTRRSTTLEEQVPCGLMVTSN